MRENAERQAQNAELLDVEGASLMRIEASILVSAEPAIVWDVATDPLLAGKWNSNVTEVRDVSTNPIGKDTTWVQVVRIMGRKTPMTARVVQWAPPAFGIVHISGPGQPRIQTTVREEGDETRLTQIMDVDDSGLGGVAMRLARPTFERELKEAIRRQKEAAEHRASSHGPRGN